MCPASRELQGCGGVEAEAGLEGARVTASSFGEETEMGR
jgi:hypothetical protein